MNKKRYQKLSDANLEIMKLVWEKSEVTINEVLEEINSKRTDKLKRATIQVQMRRLEDYGWLKHRIVGREFYYSAQRKKEEAVKDILNNLRNRIFDGSHAELVKFLFSSGKVQPDEFERIVAFLKQYEKD